MQIADLMSVRMKKKREEEAKRLSVPNPKSESEGAECRSQEMELWMQQKS